MCLPAGLCHAASSWLSDNAVQRFSKPGDHTCGYPARCALCAFAANFEASHLKLWPCPVRVCLQGGNIVGTAWNIMSQVNKAVITIPPYDKDGNTGNFSL